MAALVSRSRDGELVAAALARLGIACARGSSSRGGAAGLRAIVRLLRRGLDAAFAVDGPRGPARVVRSEGGGVGVARAAGLSGGLVVPMAAACARCHVFARARGAHEALVVDPNGQIVEGTTSNVFIVRGGEVVTPPEEAGLLAGITRAHLIEIAAEIGQPLRFAPLTPSDLASADEVFLSSSLREILPVVRVDDRPVAGGRPGPVTRALHAQFRARAGLAGAPMPWE
jgi:Amino-transferase class IV/Domain of unknown function (DUF374)